MPKPIAIKASDVFDKLPPKRKRAITKRADELSVHFRLDELRRVIDELRLQVEAVDQHVNALCAALTSLLMKKERAQKRRRKKTIKT